MTDKITQQQLQTLALEAAKAALEAALRETRAPKSLGGAPSDGGNSSFAVQYTDAAIKLVNLADELGKSGKRLPQD